MLGYHGARIIDNTLAQTGTWTIIEAITDTVFTTLTSDITYNSPTTVATGANIGILPAGTKLYGLFTAITLASGKILAYK